MINVFLGTLAVLVITSVCFCLVTIMKIVDYFINDEDNIDSDWN
jgi:hypothetical protein